MAALRGNQIMNEILVAVGGGLTVAKALEKFLGPTAEYLGEGMLKLVKKRVENLQHIFASAEAKLGDRINSPGAVPPRVLAGVVNEGSYSEDRIAIEYFGGVLASSRTEISRDDRAATFVNLVSRLSTYQLRLHYIVYGVILKLYGGSGRSIAFEHERQALRTFIPQSALIAAMDFFGEENADTILLHAIFGLDRESLIGPNCAIGDSNAIGGLGYGGTDRGLVVDPSAFGVELFLYAMGAGHLPISVFLLPQITFGSIEGVTLPLGCQSLKNPAQTPEARQIDAIAQEVPSSQNPLS
jgi:hypothetical protein